jgi:hypothetical protein
MALALITLSGCSDDGVGPTPPPAPRAESLAVSPDDLAIKVREQVQLEIRLVYNDGTVSSGADCRADNQNVTVTSAGLVTGQKPGEAIITCSASGKSATVHVRIVAPDPVFIIDPGVSEADAKLVKDAVLMVNSYLEKTFGHGVLVEDTVFVRDSTNRVSISGDGHNRIYVRTGSAEWKALGRVRRTRMIARQQAIIFWNQENHDGWFGSRAWFRHGAAEFTALKSMDYAGILPYTVGRECNVWFVQIDDPQLPSLREMSEPVDRLFAYSDGVVELSGMAVEHLVAGDITKLDGFSKAEGQWPGNFEEAFGTTADAFYADFESARAEWPQYPYHAECWQ